MNASPRVALVPSSKITVISYSPGIASIRWKVPGLTMGPLNDPSPEKVPVPLIVPYVSIDSDVSTSKLPEATIDA